MNSKKILVGVCGGIAAYKALDVVSALRKQGHLVQVVMTDAATRFVAPLTFAAVSGQPVLHTLWANHAKTLEEEYPHLYPATEADLFILLPATANTMAKIAGGFGSDVLSTSCLSLSEKCSRIFCPSMNVEMWHNPTVQANAHKMMESGWIQVGPESGHLACGMTGEGRLSSLENIMHVVQQQLSQTRPLEGTRVLILSGPTHEHLDPVRFIGNPSSGRMGQALAEEAMRLGAVVDFVTGPVPENNLPQGSTLSMYPVTGAIEMLDTARNQLANADAIIYVAAVSDYRPEKKLPQKMPKQSGSFELKLIPNPDIAATLNQEKKDQTFSIGFALQTEEGEAQAREKLQQKSLEGIVLNYADSMGAASGHFSYLAKGQSAFENWGALNKVDAARKILAKIPQPE